VYSRKPRETRGSRTAEVNRITVPGQVRTVVGMEAEAFPIANGGLLVRRPDYTNIQLSSCFTKMSKLLLKTFLPVEILMGFV
jgi:hypothetical protein